MKRFEINPPAMPGRQKAASRLRQRSAFDHKGTVHRVNVVVRSPESFTCHSESSALTAQFVAPHAPESLLLLRTRPRLRDGKLDRNLKTRMRIGN